LGHKPFIAQAQSLYSIGAGVGAGGPPLAVCWSW